MLEGHRWREERELEKFAYFTACIMNSTGMLKHPMTVDKLLGRTSKTKAIHKTPEEYKKEVEDIVKEFGIPLVIEEAK